MKHVLTRTLAVALAPIVALAPVAARADDSQKLLSQVRFTQIKSFKLHMAYHSPKGEFDKDLTYVAPDRLRLDIPSRKIAAVTIGRLIWVRDPQSKWHKEALPPKQDPMEVVHNLTEVSRAIKNKTVTYVGDQSLDGVMTHVYRLQAPPKTGFSAISEKLWLGLDGYPRKIEQKNGPFSMRATYSSLNAALSVAGP